MTFDDAVAVIEALPGVAEGRPRWGYRTWYVDGQAFAWERPVPKAELKRLGDAAPAGPVMAIALEDLHEKEAILAADHRGVFTIPHFDGHASVLIDLRSVSKRTFGTIARDGWAAFAPADR